MPPPPPERPQTPCSFGASYKNKRGGESDLKKEYVNLYQTGFSGQIEYACICVRFIFVFFQNLHFQRRKTKYYTTMDQLSFHQAILEVKLSIYEYQI